MALQWLKMDYTSPSLTPKEIVDRLYEQISTSAFRPRNAQPQDSMGVKTAPTVSDLFRDSLIHFGKCKRET